MLQNINILTTHLQSVIIISNLHNVYVNRGDNMQFIRQISDSELELMRIIWAKGGNALFSEIMSEVKEKNKNWKANTVLTFLSRLVDKGMLMTQKKGRLNEYISLVSENDYTIEQTKTFLNKVYNGNVKNLFSTLIQQDCITSDDFQELQNFWNGGKEIK